MTGHWYVKLTGGGLDLRCKLVRSSRCAQGLVDLPIIGRRRRVNFQDMLEEYHSDGVKQKDCQTRGDFCVVFKLHVGYLTLRLNST